MGKTTSTTSRTITFSKKLGNFVTSVNCDKGDVYVTVKDMTVYNNPDNYIPDFRITENHRRLELNIMNTAGNNFVVKSAVWKINGMVANGMSAYFNHGIGNNVPWLEIVGPIAMLSNNQPITIDVECQVANSPTDTDGTVVMGRKNIDVGQYREGAYRVMIAACNAEANYTITDINTPLEVQCIVYDWEGREISTGLTYKWYKLGYSGSASVWNELQNKTTKQISIPENLVDNMAQIRVEAFRNGDKIGEDTQAVYDSQDPLVLDITPSVPNENLEEGGAVQQIDYKVAIHTRDKNVIPRRAKITFYLYDSVGIPLQESVSGTARQWEDLVWVNKVSDLEPGEYNSSMIMFTVYAADFLNGGTSLTLDVKAEVETETNT